MLKRASYAWTPEDEAKLRELASNGVYLRNIALKLRRSESSIKKRARDLQIKVQTTPRSRFRFDATARTGAATIPKTPAQ
jgi:DNA-binding NarL/FixJ family response regulator